MGKGNRIDTNALFQNMVPQQPEETVQSVVVTNEEKEPENEMPVARGRKPQKEKNVQVSIYLKPDQAKELRLQDAMKEKESDKSAIARTGIDIVLKMSSDTYSKMKVVAADKDITPGELVEDALKAYLK